MSEKRQKILVTGGAGYIGSHAVRELLKEGYDAVVYDNFSRGFTNALPKDTEFVHGDLANADLLNHVFDKYKFRAVIDFAGHLEVEESMKNPHNFYVNNVSEFANLLETMMNNNVTAIVYSSSASVYGQPERTPIPESSPIEVNNIYGGTKVAAEHLLRIFDNSEHLAPLTWYATQNFQSKGSPSSLLVDGYDVMPKRDGIIAAKKLFLTKSKNK